MNARAIPAEGDFEIKAAAIERGRYLKRWNAIAAVLSGGLIALPLIFFLPMRPVAWLGGFLAGLAWANGFEYVYHRFLLHHPGQFFARGHMLHHKSVGEADEAQQITFGRAPSYVVALFVSNSIPAVAVDLWLHWGFSPAMLLAFILYFILAEEIHWRIHLGGWLPGWLEPARRYHLAHHERPNARFNVFLPLFDWLARTAR